MGVAATIRAVRSPTPLVPQRQPLVVQRMQRRHELRRGCTILAEKNLSAGKQFQSLQQEVQGLDARITERMEHLQAALVHQKAVASQFSPEAALETLKQRKNQLDDASMQLTDDFLQDPDVDEDAFCREFLSMRQAYHEASGMHDHLLATTTAPATPST